MKTVIEKTIEVVPQMNDKNKNIFNSTDKSHKSYQSLMEYVGKSVTVQYQCKFIHEGKTYGKIDGKQLSIPDTLTTEEEVRDHILAELSK